MGPPPPPHHYSDDDGQEAVAGREEELAAAAEAGLTLAAAAAAAAGVGVGGTAPAAQPAQAGNCWRRDVNWGSVFQGGTQRQVRVWYAVWMGVI